MQKYPRLLHHTETENMQVIEYSKVKVTVI